MNYLAASAWGSWSIGGSSFYTQNYYTSWWSGSQSGFQSVSSGPFGQFVVGMRAGAPFAAAAFFPSFFWAPTSSSWIGRGVFGSGLLSQRLPTTADVPPGAAQPTPKRNADLADRLLAWTRGHQGQERTKQLPKEETSKTEEKGKKDGGKVKKTTEAKKTGKCPTFGFTDEKNGFHLSCDAGAKTISVVPKPGATPSEQAAGKAECEHKAKAARFTCK